jgi:hypothetical protein
MKYINKNIRFVTVLLWIVFSIRLLEAVDIQVANDFSNIVSTEIISLRFNLAPEDQAIYKEFLRFSIDLDNVELKNWHALTEPTEQYVPLFRQNKKLYSESFSIEINLRLWRKGSAVTAENLKKANLYVVCVALDKRGENVTYNVVLPLWTEVVVGEGEHVVAENRDDSKSQKVAKDYDDKTVDRNSESAPTRGEILLDELNSIYLSLLKGLKNFLSSAFFVKFYILLWMLLLLFCFGKLFFSWPLVEAWRFIIFLWLSSSFYYMQSFFSLPILLSFFSAMCLVAAVYCLSLTRKPETLGEKFKNLLGLILAILTLPLFVKACLLGGYFGFDKWLR